MESRRPKSNTKREQAKCDAWNEKYSVGTPVRVRKDRGDHVVTVTTSEAEVLSGHTAVVWLRDISGCYLLDRVTVVEPIDKRAQLQTAEQAFRARGLSPRVGMVSVGEDSGDADLLVTMQAGNVSKVEITVHGLARLGMELAPDQAIAQLAEAFETATRRLDA